ncbi:MAG: GntR family transcriptional regulator, partial [Tistlia sp.]
MKIARSPGLTEKVARALMEEITGGGYEVGDWLPPEQVLASRFGVSRTVLREAISQLKAEGLVQGFQG